LVVSSDTPAEKSWVGGKAIAPSVQDWASEEEEPPVAADCTSLALVDGTQGELASLLVENQDLGVEQKTYFGMALILLPVVEVLLSQP